jgi:hypothetical protein
VNLETFARTTIAGLATLLLFVFAFPFRTLRLAAVSSGIHRLTAALRNDDASEPHAIVNLALLSDVTG